MSKNITPIIILVLLASLLILGLASKTSPPSSSANMRAVTLLSVADLRVGDKLGDFVVQKIILYGPADPGSFIVNFSGESTVTGRYIELEVYACFQPTRLSQGQIPILREQGQEPIDTLFFCFTNTTLARHLLSHATTESTVRIRNFQINHVPLERPNLTQLIAP